MQIIKKKDSCITILLTKDTYPITDYQDKEELSELIKKIIVKLKIYYDLELNGLIKINAYINDSVGLILEMKQLNSFDFDIEEININVSFNYDSIFLYKTNDYFSLKNIKEIYYYDNNFYTNVLNLDNINKYIEMGTIIYTDIDKITNKWIKIKDNSN